MMDTGLVQRLRPSRFLALLAAFVTTCCVSGSGPAPAPARPTAQAPSRRAVVISFDGLGGERLGRLLAQGRLTAGGFSAFAERGVVAGRAVTVTPSLTSVAHISAITGAPPSKTGIVSNVFHRSGDPLGTTVSGFASEIGSETLWEAAMRQGKRVGVIVYPGADGVNARRRGTFGMVWPERPLRHSTVVTASAFEGATSALSAEAVRAASVEVTTPTGALALRLETPEAGDEAVVNVLSATTPPKLLAAVRRGEWFRLDAPQRDGTPMSGSWCRLVQLDGGTRRLALYVGAFYGVPAYPDEYRRHLESTVGPWPGPPDPLFLRGLEAPPSEAAYEEQAMRLMEYLTRVLVVTMRRERWDLLVQYQPALDEVEHAFEPARPGGSEEKGEPIERAYQAVDRELAKVLRELGSGDSLFVCSDHGMAFVDRALDVERLLESRGWQVRRTPPDMAGGVGSREVQACVSSGIAHLYVRRDALGRPDPQELAALRDEIERFAKENGVLLDRLLAGAERSSVDLDHPNAGDLVVLLHPGFVFESSHGASTALFTPHSTGAHGYRNAYPSLDAAYLALGPDLTPARPEAVSLLDLAPEVARALGMRPPLPIVRTGARAGSSEELRGLAPRAKPPGGAR